FNHLNYRRIYNAILGKNNGYVVFDPRHQWPANEFWVTFLKQIPMIDHTHAVSLLNHIKYEWGIWKNDIRGEPDRIFIKKTPNRKPRRRVIGIRQYILILKLSNVYFFASR